MEQDVHNVTQDTLLTTIQTHVSLVKMDVVLVLTMDWPVRHVHQDMFYKTVPVSPYIMLTVSFLTKMVALFAITVTN